MAIHSFCSANIKALDSTFLQKLYCALKISSAFAVLMQNVFGMYGSYLAKYRIFLQKCQLHLNQFDLPHIYQCSSKLEPQIE